MTEVQSKQPQRARQWNKENSIEHVKQRSREVGYREDIIEAQGQTK